MVSRLCFSWVTGFWLVLFQLLAWEINYVSGSDDDYYDDDRTHPDGQMVTAVSLTIPILIVVVIAIPLYYYNYECLKALVTTPDIEPVDGSKSSEQPTSNPLTRSKSQFVNETVLHEL